MTSSCRMFSSGSIRTEKSSIRSDYRWSWPVPWILNTIPWINRHAASEWPVVSIQFFHSFFPDTSPLHVHLVIHWKQDHLSIDSLEPSLLSFLEPDIFLSSFISSCILCPELEESTRDLDSQSRLITPSSCHVHGSSVWGWQGIRTGRRVDRK